MISVSHLTKKYRGVTAVDDVSFDVDRGESVGFLGPNGAGKTTTLRILAGYVAATGGDVRVAGFNVLTQSLQVRKRIGYLPESVPLYPEMRIDEYLRHRARLKRVPSRRLNQMVAEAKERCGLHQMGRECIGRLSRGYRQRVGLADALVHDPDLLILDEPTLGLDPNQNRQVRDLIRDLAGRHTILLSTHSCSEAEEMCKRVMIIKQGRLVASDTPRHLKETWGGGNRVSVQVKGPAKEIEQKLNTLPHVKRVTIRKGDPWLECRVDSPREVDLRPAVFEMIVRNGWSLRELTLDNLSLEDVYLDITTSEPAESAESGGRSVP